MVDPVLSIRLAVEGSALDINRRVRGIEVNGPNSRSLACYRASDIDTLEEWRGDEINVLSRVREKPHHGEGNKGSHRAAVIIARKSFGRGVKELGNIEMTALS